MLNQVQHDKYFWDSPFFLQKNDKYADEVPGGVEPRRERQKSGAGARDFWKNAQEVPDSERNFSLEGYFVLIKKQILKI